MESGFLSAALAQMVSHDHLRRFLAGRIDAYICQSLKDCDELQRLTAGIWERECLNTN